MRLLLVGHNHTTAPIDVRERSCVEPARLPQFLNDLRQWGGLDEFMVLSTCNRFELYAITTASADDVIRQVCRVNGLDPLATRACWYVHEQIAAARHAAAVAAGLDSMVLGEPQILGQLKQAFETAMAAGAAGGRLRGLFSKVFAVAKQVRTRTGIGRNPVSVSQAAVDLARTVFGSLASRAVVMVGAGEMAELAVRNLRTHGVRRIFIANRTFSRAVTLAERLSAVPIMLHELPDYLAQADITIVSVAGTRHVITADLLRHPKPTSRLVVDISVPRAVAPDVAEVEGVRLCNIDDLTRTVADNRARRSAECQRAERMIEEQGEAIYAAAAAFEVAPIVVSMREQAEQTRQSLCAELQALHTSNLSYTDVEDTTRRLVARIMHQTTKLLHQFASDPAAASLCGRGNCPIRKDSIG